MILTMGYENADIPSILNNFFSMVRSRKIICSTKTPQKICHRSICSTHKTSYKYPSISQYYFMLLVPSHGYYDGFFQMEYSITWELWPTVPTFNHITYEQCTSSCADESESEIIVKYHGISNIIFFALPCHTHIGQHE